MGRAPDAAVRTDDDLLEPFHLSLEVTAGTCTLVQLAGRRAVTVDGTELDDAVCLEFDRAGTGPGEHSDDEAGATALDEHTWSVQLGAGLLQLAARRACVGESAGTPATGPAADPATGPAAGPGERTPVRPQVVVRPARAVPEWSPAPIDLDALGGDGATSADDEPRVDLAGLVPAGLALAGTVVVALVLRQPMFVVFGAVGALVAAGGWFVQHRGDRRLHRRSSRSLAATAEHVTRLLEAQCDARRRYHLETVGTLPGALRVLADLGRPSPSPGTPAAAPRPAGGTGSALWVRRADHTDAWTVSLGVGDVDWEPAVTGRSAPAWDRARAGHPQRWGLVGHVGSIDGVPVPVDLGPGAHLALTGPHAVAVARSLLVQLAVQTGPADWQLVVVTDRPERWAWLDGLAHVLDGTGTPRRFDPAAFDEAVRRPEVFGSSGPGSRHTVVVTDRPDLLAVRTGSLRRLLASERNPACITVVEPDPATEGAALPAVCRSVLETRRDGRAAWTPDLTVSGLPRPVRLVGAAAATAATAAGVLSGRTDPEDSSGGDALVPAHVRLLDLPGIACDPDDLVRAWSSLDPDAPADTPIGMAADGLVEIDLGRDGPHGLLAGTTGAGKSELLRSLVVGLAARRPPEQLVFVLVDYKGGSAFDVLASLPHVVGSVTDLDDRLAERALRSLRAELTRRERILRDLQAVDLAAARRATGVPVLPRLMVVVDEFAALAVELPDFLHALVGIAQRGRSLGVHLLLATQRPNGVIGDDIRANTNLRLALRLQDTADAVDVVGVPIPVSFPRSRPGRALLRLGADEFVTFQAARCADADLDRLVSAIVEAERRRGTAPPDHPWLPALPEYLPATALADSPSAVGLVDLPDEQRRAPLTWTPEDGHLLVVGAVGSGVTSTLHTLAVAHLINDPTADVTVVDAVGDGTWDDLAAHPRCRGVVRLHEGERIRRALLGLAAGPGRPGEPAGGGVGRRTVVIDGLDALRRALDDLDRDDELRALLACLGEGSTTLLLGADTVGAAPPSILARVPHRWSLHLHDPQDAVGLGVVASLVPPAIPGRVVIAGLGAEAQLVHPSDLGAALHSPVSVRRPGTSVPPILELPARVPPEGIGVAQSDQHGVVLPVGLGFDDLRPLVLDVPGGDHVLVVGPARSGRSATLVRLAAAWADARPGGVVHVVAPRRSPWWTIPSSGHATGLPARRLEDELDLVISDVGAGRPVLLVVDDAELVDDPSGRLAGLLTEHHPGLLVLAAGRGEALRQTYGHWTGVLRRSRLGLVMAAGSDLDGDLLGAALPRRLPIPARPGLAHLVADGTTRLVQVAEQPPADGADDGADDGVDDGGCNARATARVAAVV